jgi:hypothetical protein
MASQRSSVARIAVAALAAVLAAACSGPAERPGRLTVVGDRVAAADGPARGPLSVLAANPRYFTDGSGRAILLTGSHTWNNRQDIGDRHFDWPGYLDRLRGYNHNFIRLWVEEQPKGLNTGPDPTEPTPAIGPELLDRSGPGRAADGGLKFDLTRYNAAHFERLRRRTIEARDRGIYVSVMLFNGWSIDRKAGGGDPWAYHPFNHANNVNDMDGDPNHDGSGASSTRSAISRTCSTRSAMRVTKIRSSGSTILLAISSHTNAHERCGIRSG